MRKHKIAKWRIAPALVAAGLLLGGCGEQTAGSAQQAASAPQQVAAQGKKKIVVGVDFNYPPMTFQTASGEKKGFDIDLMREAFKRKDDLVFMDFRIDSTENVYPMIKGGQGLNEMILSSDDL